MRRAERIRVFVCGFLILLVALPLLQVQASEDSDTAQKELKRRQKTEWMRFYRQNPKNAEVPQTGMSVEFFNQAVSFFKSQEYDLAHQALVDSIRLNDRNSFAYELLGDIAQIEHDLKNAKAYYTKAYLLKPSPELQEKFEKINRELSLEDQFLSEETEHFFFKYKADERSDIQELGPKLEDIYAALAKTFGEQVRRRIVVVFYEPEEFRRVTELPHWVSGVYDGKIRLPVYRWGLERYNLEAIAAHEMTHAFVAEMSASKAPSWINEGLAVYEEQNYEKKDMIVFRAAVRTGTLLEIDHLMNENRVVKEKDPLFANLFYDQSYMLVRYMIERYGMFEIKQLLKSFGQGKNYDEAILEVLKTDPVQLDAEWRSSLVSVPELQ